jgi:hypothetical protein
MAQTLQAVFNKTVFNTAALSLISAIGFGSLTSVAVADTLTHVFKPARGVSLDVGSKKVAGYYMVSNGGCDLTLMIANRPDADGNVEGQSVRMNVPVKAGSKARVFTTEGKLLEFSCSMTTNIMTARDLEQTAFVAK